MGIAVRNVDYQVVQLRNPGTQAAAVARDVALAEMDGYIANIYAELETAGTTGNQISDIHRAAAAGASATIFTGATKITHATTSRTATYSAVSATEQKVKKGDRFSLDVDSIHTTAAIGLVVYIHIKKRDPGAVKNVAPPG